MMKNLVNKAFLAALAIVAASPAISYMTRGSQGDPCAATGSAKFHAEGDLMAEGRHEITLTPSSFRIQVAKSWGGGTVDVPADAITISLVVQRKPEQTDRAAANRGTRFDIVAMRAVVQSIGYPRGVASGLNTFTVDPTNAVVKLDSSAGMATLRGSAHVTLANALFSNANPATVEANFQGTFDFKSGNGTLTSLAITAHAPKKS